MWWLSYNLNRQTPVVCSPVGSIHAVFEQIKSVRPRKIFLSALHLSLPTHPKPVYIRELAGLNGNEGGWENKSVGRKNNLEVSLRLVSRNLSLSSNSPPLTPTANQSTNYSTKSKGHTLKADKFFYVCWYMSLQKSNRYFLRRPFRSASSVRLQAEPPYNYWILITTAV